MDNFQIETAQNVNIAQNVAGVGERILAFLVDVVIMVAYGFLVAILFAWIDVDSDFEWVISCLLYTSPSPRDS